MVDLNLSLHCQRQQTSSATICCCYHRALHKAPAPAASSPTTSCTQRSEPWSRRVLSTIPEGAERTCLLDSLQALLLQGKPRQMLQWWLGHPLTCTTAFFWTESGLQIQLLWSREHSDAKCEGDCRQLPSQPGIICFLLPIGRNNHLCARLLGNPTLALGLGG